MPQFLATAPQGLFDVLSKELEARGFKNIKSSTLGVFFESSWSDCYDFHLRTRIASRILKPVMEFVCYQPEELYNHIRKHDFTKYIEPYQTLRVKTKVSDCKLNDQRSVTLKIKDAVVDQFRDKTGARPDIADEADLTIYVRGQKNLFLIAVDLTGESLFKRGYRLDKIEAPLKENLAAGLLEMAEYDGQQILVDPMCGSGTFLIEAALKTKNSGPLCTARSFAFQNFKNFNTSLWQKIENKKKAEPEAEVLPLFFGFDKNPRAIFKAKENAVRAGVSDLIHFETVATDKLRLEEILRTHLSGVREDFSEEKSEKLKGMVITNPPYGERMGDEAEAREALADLGAFLKTQCSEWTAWILSGNADSTQALKMKSTRKAVVFNGPIECRFLKYEIFKPMSLKSEREELRDKSNQT